MLADADGPWRLDYADGRGNRYTLEQRDDGTIDLVYDPVTKATSSSGLYDGGPPRRTTLAADDPRLAQVRALAARACRGPSVARSKGTGAFAITTAAGVTEHVAARGPALDALDTLLATLG